MAERITLKTYLVYEAMIARTPGTSKDLADAVNVVLAELEADGWDRDEKRSWDEWRGTELL